MKWKNTSFTNMINRIALKKEKIYNFLCYVLQLYRNMLVSAQVFVYLCVYIKTTINKKLNKLLKKQNRRRKQKVCYVSHLHT